MMKKGEGNVSVVMDVVRLNFFRGYEMVIVVSAVIAAVVVCGNV